MVLVLVVVVVVPCARIVVVVLVVVLELVGGLVVELEVALLHVWAVGLLHRMVSSLASQVELVEELPVAWAVEVRF